jgi:hypothetical protein
LRAQIEDASGTVAANDPELVIDKIKLNLKYSIVAVRHGAGG